MSIKILYFVPARGGSKRVKNKNCRLVGNTSLIDHTLRFISLLGQSSNAVVSTDSTEVKASCNCFNIKSVQRPEHLCGDDVSTEDVLIEYIGSNHEAFNEYTWICLLQPTSPFRSLKVFDMALKDLATFNNEIDCLLSYHETKEDMWISLDSEGGCIKRLFESAPRRSQLRDPIVIENGNFYFTKVKSLLAHQSILGKVQRGFKTSYMEGIDINTEFDLMLTNTLASLPEVLLEFPGEIAQ